MGQRCLLQSLSAFLLIHIFWSHKRITFRSSLDPCSFMLNHQILLICIFTPTYTLRLLFICLKGWRIGLEIALLQEGGQMNSLVVGLARGIGDRRKLRLFPCRTHFENRFLKPVQYGIYVSLQRSLKYRGLYSRGRNECKKRSKRIFQVYGVLLDLAEVCQQKVNVCAAMELMLLQVPQINLRYLIKLCKFLGLKSFIPHELSIKFDS